jgi:hypothetical protein
LIELWALLEQAPAGPCYLLCVFPYLHPSKAKAEFFSVLAAY